jgi:hypothetical protein
MIDDLSTVPEIYYKYEELKERNIYHFCDMMGGYEFRKVNFKCRQQTVSSSTIHLCANDTFTFHEYSASHALLITCTTCKLTIRLRYQFDALVAKNSNFLKIII